MNKLSSIISNEQRIDDVSNRIIKVSIQGGLIKLFFLEYLKSKLKKLESLQFSSIDEYLSETDEEYKNTIQKNYELLKTKNIVFTVYHEEFSFFGNHTKTLEGDIHQNGYSYSKSGKTNLKNFDFDKTEYIEEMKGKIDYWGKLNLKTTKTKFAMFKNLPKKFIGEIGSEGAIEIRNVENDLKIISPSVNIGKLIANHFGNDENKNQEFNSNKLYLKNRIEDFRKELKTRKPI